MDPEKMKKARSLGLVNFSGWVNTKIDDFIKDKENDAS